ncbi:Retrovirus-related Pol polyprotein [Labeo rohita]|uniref:Retrovirus-related Pol polyprotein n=1 Tax=Labeo rohita TaxID=84645 RepID=A0ABQ8LF53_LABRO|nr:Retrovirus-related Pol polyprotein [Labeo rohita]
MSHLSSMPYVKKRPNETSYQIHSVIGKPKCQLLCRSHPAVRTWPIPSTLKELQCFLGFTNFYHRLNQNYSSVTALFTCLLKGRPKSLAKTIQAFHPPKEAFTTASLTGNLQKPSRVRAVLSQQQGNPSCLHPCAFFQETPRKRSTIMM